MDKKEGKSRPHGGAGHFTEAERRNLLADAVDMLERGHSRRDIGSFIAEKYGCARESASRFVTMAIEEFRYNAARDRGAAKARILAVLWRALRTAIANDNFFAISSLSSIIVKIEGTAEPETYAFGQVQEIIDKVMSAPVEDLEKREQELLGEDAISDTTEAD